VAWTTGGKRPHAEAETGHLVAADRPSIREEQHAEACDADAEAADRDRHI